MTALLTFLFRSLYTLFQVLTGESWSEAVARPTMFGKGGGADGKGMNGGAVLPRTLEAYPKLYPYPYPYS